mmetsp:Transcript_11225/g.52099  ORF Transcript_11225/g.52099 Transcript_11225/m.52099 type:complete len:263 (+) Transcript_11225:911-1699(+)
MIPSTTSGTTWPTGTRSASSARASPSPSPSRNPSRSLTSRPRWPPPVTPSRRKQRPRQRQRPHASPKGCPRCSEPSTRSSATLRLHPRKRRKRRRPPRPRGGRSDGGVRRRPPRLRATSRTRMTTTTTRWRSPRRAAWRSCSCPRPRARTPPRSPSPSRLPSPSSPPSPSRLDPGPLSSTSPNASSPRLTRLPESASRLTSRRGCPPGHPRESASRRTSRATFSSTGAWCPAAHALTCGPCHRRPCDRRAPRCTATEPCSRR